MHFGYARRPGRHQGTPAGREFRTRGGPQGKMHVCLRRTHNAGDKVSRMFCATGQGNSEKRRIIQKKLTNSRKENCGAEQNE
eukprot:247965-Prorocentrum_minimum.AAC.3